MREVLEQFARSSRIHRYGPFLARWSSHIFVFFTLYAILLPDRTDHLHDAGNHLA